MMAKHLYNGISKIKSSEFWKIIFSIIGILIIILKPRSLFDIIRILLVSILGIFSMILSLTIWVFKILGWGYLCKLKIKNFYCWTRLAILIFPILGLLAMIIVFITVFLNNPSYIYQLNFDSNKELRLILFFTAIFFSVGYIFESVAIYDLSIVYKNKTLKYGSIMYLLAVIISPIISMNSTRNLYLSILGNMFQVVISLFIYNGLSNVQKTIIYDQQYPRYR